MSKLFTDFLDKNRLEVWKKLWPFAKNGILGGGTALMFHIGHRVSYDFDIFFEKPISKIALVRLKENFQKGLAKTLVDTPDELTVIVAPDIKVTLLYYPFPPLHAVVKTGMLPIFDLRDIASSKAYTIGRRGAFRDYVDMYFILRKHVQLATVIQEAQKRYGGAFSDKLFLEQLQYFEDIQDFSVEYAGEKISVKEIQRYLAKAVKAYVKKIVQTRS